MPHAQLLVLLGRIRVGSKARVECATVSDASSLCREEEAVNEAELPPEEFEAKKKMMKQMREQVGCSLSNNQIIIQYLFATNQFELSLYLRHVGCS